MMKKILLFVVLFGYQTTIESQIEVEAFRSEYEQVNDDIYDINDANEGSSNYSITAGNNNNYYQIDSGSGVITILNTISDTFNSVHTDVLTVTIGSTSYTITIRDGYDYYIANLDPGYLILDEHNDTYNDNTSEWTAINNLWGRGTAVPNTDFRIATIYKPNLPNSSILIWDVPSKASDFGGASVWCYNNLFWGNRTNSREDLFGFPFQISSLESLSVDFDFEQLFGNEKFKIAMNMFMTDEDVLTNFSANDGDFFFVFDQNGTFVPNYTNTLSDITLGGKPFAVRYDLNPDNGYERRRVIVKDNEKFMSGNLDVKALFDMFADNSFLNTDQYIYHLQFGIEVTEGYGAVRFNQLEVNGNVGTTYYVDQQNGDDTNDGVTTTTAFETFDQAEAVVSPGDTIEIIGEYTNTSYNPSYVYPEDGDTANIGDISDPHIWHSENTIRINNLHGTASQPITIKAHDENTLLKGDGANIFRVSNSSYLNIEDFEIQGEVNNIPLAVAEALQFVYKDSNGDIYYRVQPGTSPSVVETMTFPSLSNITRPSYTDTRGFYFSDVHHIKFMNNEIHHVPGNGFRVAKCDYIDIIGNEVHNTSRKSYSGTHGLVVTEANSFDSETGYKINIIGNKVHHNYNEIYSWAPTKTIITPHIDEGKGISLQRNDDTDGRNWTHGRFLVANNITYWNGFSGIHTNVGLRMDFINNTCYYNSYTKSVTLDPYSGLGGNIGISSQSSDDIRMINNIVVIDGNLSKSALAAANTTNLVVADNIIYGSPGTITEDPEIVAVQTNTQIIDPEFNDTANFDFSLQDSSPAIGAANTSYSPTEDFFGFTRDATPDLGALENSSNPPISPVQMVIDMGRGINAGNVMSAPVEGNWAPAFTVDYFSDIKDAGFTTVRIPIDFFGTRTSGDTSGYSSTAGTSGSYSGTAADYLIDANYLDRVEQVITWALDQGLVTILDVHGATLKTEFIETFDDTEPVYTNPSSAKRAADNDKFRAIWTQIANRFKDYSYNLLFEIINEPYFHMSASDMDALNSDIITIIRDTESKNTKRNIIITGGSENSFEAPLQINPTLIASDNNLIATFHYYWPRAFTASSEETHNDFDWGTAVDKAEIVTNFGAVQSWSQTNSIPVLLGEFGADNEGGYNYNTETYGSFGGPDNASRVEYHRYLAQKAIDLGFAFTAWDAGHKSNKTIYKVSDRTWVEDVKDALLGLSTTTYSYNGAWTPSNPSGVSTSIDDIHILSGTASSSSDNIGGITTANSLIVDSGAKLVVDVDGALQLSNIDNQGTLTIRSNTNQYGSLIVDNVVSEGLLEYRLYVNSYAASNGNDLISAPFTGDTFGVFEQYQSNDLNIYENPSNSSVKLFGPFEKTNGLYVNYDVDESADFNTILEPGIGYRSGSDPASTNSPNTFVFKGNINTSDVENVGISNSGLNYKRWNLIGNPYPSYIDFESFYNTNVSQFDDGVYKAIWGYNATANTWTIWNNLTILDNTVTELIAPGQGFFVTSKTSGGLINFTADSRTTGMSNNFITNKSASSLNLSKAVLNLYKNSENYTTDIYFVDNATQGVDPGYDAAAFGGSASAIFSKIVDGSSQEEIAIQALPYNNYNNVIIPLGVKATQGEQIRIGLNHSNLTIPSEINIYLEDNLTNTWTLLNTSDYTFTPSSTIEGAGRFFVHFSATTLSNPDVSASSLVVYVNQNRKTLIINGWLHSESQVVIYDIQGRQVLKSQLESNTTENSIDVSLINTGIYIVKLHNSSQQKTQKIIIK